MFNKLKKYSNVLIATTTVAAVTAGVSVTLHQKLKKPFLPSFYNFKAYMSEENKGIISKTFDYKQFSEINEFYNAILNNKAAAGIGTDFLATQLIRKHLIAKIDYSVLFDMPILKDNYELTKQMVKLTLRKDIWYHLEQYDKYLEKDEFGRDLNAHLWEYFYPYFSQDAVVAYNTNKVTPSDKEHLNEEGEIDFESYHSQYGDDLYHMVNLLKIISQNGYKNWIITDAIRDNLLYGSSYWLIPDEKRRTSEHFTGEVENNTYSQLIDSFISLIKDGTGFDVKDSEHITFEGDGLQIVNNLINHQRPDINAAIMYNGDAIDSYYGEDNFPGEVGEGEIRVVKPKFNILLIDGLVLSNKNTEKQNFEYLNVFKNSFYNNLPSFKSLYEQFKEQGINIFDSSALEKTFYEKSLLDIWSNLKVSEFEEIFTKEESEVLVNKLSQILSWSNLDNQEITEHFKESNQLHKAFLDGESSEDAALEDWATFYPQVIRKYLQDNGIDGLLQQIVSIQTKEKSLQLFDDAINASKDQAYKLTLKYLLKGFEEDFKDLEETLNEKEALLAYFARKIALINFANEAIEAKIAEKYLSLDNFNFINYNPTQEIDYDFVLRNYFATPIDGYDPKVISIYEIVESKNNTHKGILPVDEKLQSLITTTYFQRTKS